MTVGRHLAKLKAYAMIFSKFSRVPDQTLIKNIELARNGIVEYWVGIKEDNFRESGTFADGDPWPDNWNKFAGRAYRDSGGTRTPLTYIETAQVAESAVNPFAKAYTTTSPVIFFVNQSFAFLPAALSGVTVQYYKFPQDLAVDPPDLSLDDEMPEESADMITFLAYEYTLGMIIEDPESLNLSKADVAEAEEAQKIFYASADYEILKPVRMR